MNIGEVINDLVDKLRSGKIRGSIHINIDDSGKVNEIIVRRSDNIGELEDEIKKIQLKGRDLSKVNFSGMDLSGSNLSRTNLSGANFSSSIISDANISNANLNDANFYKASITQTDMSGAYGVKDLSGAYMTGSVNLYNINPQTGSISNPYDYFAKDHADLPDDTRDISRILMGRSKNY